MLEFIRTRKHNERAVQPLHEEIHFLEVFKKLTECGWVVNLPEFRQIIEYLGIRGAELHLNLQLSEYFMAFLAKIGVETKGKTISDLLG
jgi:hypothetical protein